MAKREFSIKINDADQLVSWYVGDTVKLTFDAKKASAENTAHAALHGFKQAIGDTAALDKGATLEQKIEAMAAKAAWFEDSANTSWNQGGGGARPFDVGMLVMALATVKFGSAAEADVAKASEFVDRVAEAYKLDREGAAKQIAKDEKVAAEIAIIRARKAPTKVSLDEMDKMLTEFAAAPSGDAPTEPTEPEPTGKGKRAK